MLQESYKVVWRTGHVTAAQVLVVVGAICTEALEKMNEVVQFAHSMFY